MGLFEDTEHTMTFSRLQDYVRTGADRAEILVSLQNEGEAAYKSEVFGSSVTFQRIIWSSGQSFFSLLDQGGSIVKTHEEARVESKKILQVFRISPCAILLQGEARELLRVKFYKICNERKL